MAPVVLRELRRGARLRVDARNALRLAGAVLFGGMLAPVLLLAALRLTVAGSISLLLNLEMVATAVLGVVLFRDHLGRSAWTGVAGVVTAGALVAWDGGLPGLQAALLTAAACTCWGLDNNLTALIDGMTPAQSTTVKGLVAGATNLTIGILGAPFVAGPEIVAASLLVGALSYGASIVFYIVAAHELGATRAQAIFASAPFVGAVLAFAALGEPLRAAQVAAAALMVPSIVAMVRSRHAHVHVHEPIEHTHSHRHDDGHHLHDHPGQAQPAGRHTHVHRHERLVHAHPHWPDVHHRHEHSA